MRFALVALVCVATVAVFFRFQIADGFRVLSGDRYDGTIALAILEHWRNVFSGASVPGETYFFHPVPDALGYNDGYFIFGLVYSLFRAMGLDPYLSGELVNVVLRIVCFVATYAACRKILALDVLWAMLAAVLATLSESMAAQALHAQLFSVGLAPLMALLMHVAVRAFLARETRSFLFWSGTAAILFGAWLLTAFYTAWFFTLFLGLFVIAYALLAPTDVTERWMSAVRAQLPAVGLAVTFVILSLVPFLFVYLPKALETGQHDYNEVLRNTPSVLDLVNVGAGNLFYGALVARLHAYFWPPISGWSEQVVGFPLILLSLFLCAAIWLWRNRARADEPQARIAQALTAAILVSWLLMVHVGNVSAWAAVYALIPGAHAIRVVSRYELFLALPLIAVAVLFLARISSRLGAALTLGLCILLVAEQLDTAPPLHLIRAKELAHLDAVPAPPASCRVFFTSAAWQQGLTAPDPSSPDDPEAARLRRLADGAYAHNVDAMLIAETRHIPTLNGFATFLPPGFDLFNPADPSYRARVARYAKKTGQSDGLCALDLNTLRWETNPFSG